MRKIDRSRVQVPDSLSDASDAASSRELLKARNDFAIDNSASFEFTAYKSPDVVVALHKLFQGKCAYCESSFKAVSPTDVEHFRPKGKVAECEDHPGYWWLAAKWDNLLASCIDCNRRRYQRVVELDLDPFVGGVQGEILMGKHHSFPIFGNQYARGEADDLVAEDPALIDPTRSDPADHLVWVEQQDLSLVGPRVRNGALDRYGTMTYRAIGLNRQGLVEERTRRVREVKAQVVRIEQMLDLAVTLPDPGGAELRDMAFDHFSRLHQYAEPDQPYSAAIESLLERESERLAEKYAKLLSPVHQAAFRVGREKKG